MRLGPAGEIRAARSVRAARSGVASGRCPLWRYWTAGLSAAALLLVACSGTKVESAPKAQDGVPVVTAKVEQKPVPVDINVIGNVEAYATISVKAQIGGELMKVYFQEGDFVRKGDLLFQIDPRPYQAALKLAEANLARDRAQASLAEANLAKDIYQQKYAEDQSRRYSRLFEEGVASKEQNDQMRTSADASAEAVRADKAAIESARAAVAADQAAVERAKLDLSYCEIRSPIDGRTGNLSVKQGNVVKATDVELVTINQVQPIYVTFSVPESQLPEVKKYMAQGKVTVFATIPNENVPPEQGVLTFVDNAVDLTTGTIKLKGTFPNPGRKLWPGQFVRVALRLTTEPNAVVVQSQAVQTGQDGKFVFVVKPDMTVESRPVIVGRRIDQEVVIEKGLQAGEVVVTDGQLRLAPGVRVQPKNPQGA